MLGRVSDSMGRVAMLKMSCVGNIIGALGSLYATGRWTFIASRSVASQPVCVDLLGSRPGFNPF